MMLSVGVSVSVLSAMDGDLHERAHRPRYVCAGMFDKCYRRANGVDKTGSLVAHRCRSIKLS